MPDDSFLLFDYGEISSRLDLLSFASRLNDGNSIAYPKALDEKILGRQWNHYFIFG